MSSQSYPEPSANRVSLTEKLARIYGPSGPQQSELQERLEKLNGAGGHSLVHSLQGQWKERSGARFLTVDRDWDSDYRHGRHELAEIFSISPELVGLLAGNSDFDNFDVGQTIFLDTETTGLAGGAGTFVFLVGLGFFEGGCFKTRQLFLPSYDAERAFLEELDEILGSGRFRYLVTFNGKSYDVNLLENRFVLQRIVRPFASFHHLDMLYPSRLLWRGCFEDCALQTLEGKLLGLTRRGDIPSALIPRVYFDFLHGGQVGPLARVLEHNRQDLVTLAALVSLAARLIHQPDRCFYVDPLAASRLHQLRGNLEKAAELLAGAIDDHTLGGQWRSQALFQLALLQKRRGSPGEALSLLLRLLQMEAFPPRAAFEEAAKILEHDNNDLKRALSVVERARTLYRSPELEHRCHRLRCRIEGRRWY